MANDYVPFEVDVDLSNTPSWDGESRPLVPVGTYKVEIVGVDNKGKRIEVKFKILEGEQADAFVYNGYQIDNETGLKRMRNLLVACGASLNRINSNELMGAVLYVDVIHNESTPKPDEMGNPKPTKTFANVQKERSLQAEEGAADADPQPEKPPVTRQPAPAPETKPADTVRRTTARRA